MGKVALKLRSEQAEARRGLGLMSSKKKAEVLANEAIYEQAQASLDFRAYRAPDDQRRLMVSRYYMAQLRSRSRGWSSGFREKLTAAARHSRDIRGFIQEAECNLAVLSVADLDLSAELEEEQNPKEPPPPFWCMSDETTMDLINLAGRLLVGVKPFKEHPANKESAERGSREPWKASTADITPSKAEIERAVDRVAKKQLNEECGGGRQEKHRKGSKEVHNLADDEPSPNPVDLDEVFGGFTPRLEEEALQNQENRRRPSVASTEGSDTGLIDADKGLENLRSTA